MSRWFIREHPWSNTCEREGRRGRGGTRGEGRQGRQGTGLDRGRSWPVMQSPQKPQGSLLGSFEAKKSIQRCLKLGQGNWAFRLPCWLVCGCRRHPHPRMTLPGRANCKRKLAAESRALLAARPANGHLRRLWAECWSGQHRSAQQRASFQLRWPSSTALHGSISSPCMAVSANLSVRHSQTRCSPRSWEEWKEMR